MVANCADNGGKLYSVRARLKALRREERDDPLFRDLKSEGDSFIRELLMLVAE